MAVRVDEIPCYEMLRDRLWENYSRMADVRLRYIETMRDRHPDGITDEVLRQELADWERIYTATEVMWEAMERLWKGKESPLLAMTVPQEH